MSQNPEMTRPGPSIAELRAVIDRVVSLHKSTGPMGGVPAAMPLCYHCSHPPGIGGEAGYVIFPCPTLRAVAGVTEQSQRLAEAQFNGWLTRLHNPAPVATPDSKLPPLVPDGPRRHMLVRIEVSADFEKRLDNQWEVEREINADRWGWWWEPEIGPADVADHIQRTVEALSGTSIGKAILREALK